MRSMLHPRNQKYFARTSSEKSLNEKDFLNWLNRFVGEADRFFQLAVFFSYECCFKKNSALTTYVSFDRTKYNNLFES